MENIEKRNNNPIEIEIEETKKEVAFWNLDKLKTFVRPKESKILY